MSLRLSSVQMAQLGRLYRAAQTATDPERTGVGRLALQEFERAGAIRITGEGKGRRVIFTALGLQALSDGAGKVNS
jgi:hypothetical protein